MTRGSSVAAPRRRSVWQLAVQSLRDGGPGMCQFAITSLCNARCAFCDFAVDRMPVHLRKSVSLEEAKLAAEVLYRNGVQFLIYVGGEPLVHPDLAAMVAHASAVGLSPMVVTNGSLLTPQRMEELVDAGLRSAIISIDAADVAKHEANRGLRGVCEQIREANAYFRGRGVGTTASVTMSRLIDDYSALPDFLRALGFDSITFSYPLTTLASPYLGYSDSRLVDYDPEELHQRFEAVKALKRRFHVVNPTASLEDMQRHLKGEPERFGCLGGHKFFYLGWDLQLYRCHNWATPMCHVSEFDGSQRVRDGCTACMMDCYRDSSVLQHVAVSAAEGVAALSKGRVAAALKHWVNRRSLASLKAVLEEARWLKRL